MRTQHTLGGRVVPEYFGGIPLFCFWQENLMSHMTYDVEGTQDAISDPL